MSIRGLEGLPLVPYVAESYLAWGRIVPLLSSILGSFQRNLSQGRRQGLEARVLHESSTSRRRRKVPTNGKARLRLGHSSLQAEAILPSPHYRCPDWHTSPTGNEQSRSCRMDDIIGYRTEWVWRAILPAYCHKGTSDCQLHCGVHQYGRIGGRRTSSLERPHRWII